MLNHSKWRKDFPALQQRVNGKPLVYLDSGATSLKPQSVIDRLNYFNTYEIANVHRGAHFLSDQATGLYEAARKKVADFIGASKAEEIVFVRGTTEAINLVANSLGQRLVAGDEIIVSELEHHANIVPWQMIAESRKLIIKVLPILDNGDPDFSAFEKLLSPKTKILAISACSNHIGNVVDLKPFLKLASQRGVISVVDGAQLVGKQKIDVQKLGCDFFCFSGHKMFAPFGIGAVYGKESLLATMPPYQGGGSMISKVAFTGTTYNEVPMRFEAGTPNVEGAVGLAAAIDYLNSFSWEEIESYEEALSAYTRSELEKVAGLKIVGSPNKNIPLFSFTIDGIHHSDLGQVLDKSGIAIRAGHHCTQPLLSRLGLKGTCRVSMSLYNDKFDIDELIKALNKAKDLLS